MEFKVFAGAAGAVKIFSDSLLRTATAALGSPWVVGYSDPTQVGWYIPTGGISCNNTRGLIFQNTTGGGSSVSIPIIPAVSLAWAGKTQFSEAAVTQNITNFSSTGPAVGMSGDSSTGTQNGYYLNIQSPGAANAIGVNVANVGNRVINAGVGTWATNDVIRISVQFQATQNVILVSQNKVLIATLTDNNALRPLATNGGMPGMYYKGATAGASCSFSTFRGGLGLG